MTKRIDRTGYPPYNCPKCGKRILGHCGIAPGAIDGTWQHHYCANGGPTIARTSTLIDCERHTGCPTCKAKPGEVCTNAGQPSQPHLARWRLHADLRQRTPYDASTPAAKEPR